MKTHRQVDTWSVPSLKESWDTSGYYPLAPSLRLQIHIKAQSEKGLSLKESVSVGAFVRSIVIKCETVQT